MAPTKETKPDIDGSVSEQTSGNLTEKSQVSGRQAQEELAAVSVRVLILQTALILCFAGLMLFVKPDSMTAVAFGGLLGIGSTLLSRRSVERSARAATQAPHLGLIPVYAGLLNKFLVVGGGLALGLIVLGLSPLFVVAGYLLSQLALIIVMLGFGRKA